MPMEAAARAKPRRRIVRESVLDTPDPIDIAMAAAASGKPLPDVARRVLEEQAHLIHAQCAELRLRKIGEGVRAVLWGVLAIAAAAILALIIAIIVRASRSDALIVQSFRVPPALQAQGLTGEVIATQVLDKLSEFQEQSQSARAASSYANNWEDELKIDIPNTGASTDQVWKVLRGWLGKETRISGEVIQTKDGLALTTRVGSEPGRRFVSPTGDLDALVSQGAELIYRQTQPYRYSIWLSNHPDRVPEMGPILQRLARDPSEVERKWALNGLGYLHRLQGDLPGAVAIGERAVALDPRFPTGVLNVGVAHLLMGHDQTAVDLYRRQQGFPINNYDERILVPNRCRLQVEVASSLRDPDELDRAASCLEASSNASDLAPFWRAVSGLLRHDPRLAAGYRAQPSPNISAGEVPAFTALMQMLAQMQAGPSPALIEVLDRYGAAAERNASSSPLRVPRAVMPARAWPRQAEALVMLGRLDEAQALAARTPLDCYYCLRVRGLVVQAKGDPMTAQRWFAEAVKQGPRLPAAYVDWARLLAAHKRFGGAEARFAKAAELAPNWADPLKYWGDALAAQGKRTEALAKYEAALKLAPNWAELRRARARLSRT